MNSFINAINVWYTQNGALTHTTTVSKCLDLFSVIGNRNDYSNLFWEAYEEDPQTAVRILFWSRDCRGGAGTRLTFNKVMEQIQSKPKLQFLYQFIPEYGSWKDIFKLKPSLSLAYFVFNTLMNESTHSLCAKYCPRKGLWFNTLRKISKMSSAEFRHFIVSKTQVVENLMCKNEWQKIQYDKVPSIAGIRYTEAFTIHDKTRYYQYLQDVKKGNKKINASVLYPHDVVMQTYKHKDSAKVLWDALPNYMEGCVENILPICDVSGSMSGLPMAISVSLGCYISERNKGDFKDYVITFSANPQLIHLEGDIDVRLNTISEMPCGMDTNLQAVFDLILQRSIEKKVPQKDMPTKLLIISDMEFNFCQDNKTNFEEIKEKYSKSGYKMPSIIFWNVKGNLRNYPTQKDENNVALVSGYSPSILTHLLKGEILSPIQIMTDTVNSKRYQCINL